MVFIATLAFFVNADNVVTRADADIVRWASSWRTVAVGDVAAGVSLLGNVLVLAPLAIAAGIASAVRHGRHRFTALPALALTAAAVFDPLAKAAVGRPRPPVALAEVIETASGYPSGHSAQATAFWLALAFLFTASATRPRPWVIAGAVMAILVGLSRIVLGVHSPTDVLAGWALGLACVLMTRELLLLPRRSDARPAASDGLPGPGTRKASRQRGLTLSSAPTWDPLSVHRNPGGILCCLVHLSRLALVLAVAMNDDRPTGSGPE